MGGFVQDVEGQPSAGVGDGSLPLAERPATAGEPLQRTSQLPAQALDWRTAVVEASCPEAETFISRRGTAPGSLSGGRSGNPIPCPCVLHSEEGLKPEHVDLEGVMGRAKFPSARTNHPRGPPNDGGPA